MLLNVTPYGLETKIRIQITFLSKIVRHLRFIVLRTAAAGDVAIDGNGDRFYGLFLWIL